MSVVTPMIINGIECSDEDFKKAVERSLVQHVKGYWEVEVDKFKVELSKLCPDTMTTEQS